MWKVAGALWLKASGSCSRLDCLEARPRQAQLLQDLQGAAQVAAVPEIVAAAREIAAAVAPEIAAVARRIAKAAPGIAGVVVPEIVAAATDLSAAGWDPWAVARAGLEIRAARGVQECQVVLGTQAVLGVVQGSQFVLE